MLRAIFALTLLTATSFATSKAQWQLQDAHTTADLRGIDNVGGGVAWASGSDGTILRTEDAGFVWQLCAKPPGGEHLDFRAIQAFDNNTAIAMSSGKGDLSRLYKTTDGCQTWKLVFTNPDPDGFWDALQIGHTIPKEIGTLFILGDPVDGQFRFFENDPDDRDPDFSSFESKGESWTSFKQKGLEANPEHQGVFAASNTALNTGDTLRIFPFFGTGGTGGAYVFFNTGTLGCPEPHCGDVEPQTRLWRRVRVPIGNMTQSSGIFSLACKAPKDFGDTFHCRWIVAVGGDYQKSNDSTGTAAFTTDGGRTWTASSTPPHGYRSAVAYDAPTKTWITVGPNGTDISTDDGRNWRALHPDPKFNETPNADQHWNALSLPYVVGPHGRIATLRPSALSPTK
jgi:photosystem II stability/assembly factor-like uncharacterized protein